MEFSGTLSGANEVPAVTSDGSGNVMGVYDDEKNILKLTINYSGIHTDSITMWHVHKGAAGVSGAPLSNLTYPKMTASPFTWSDTLSAENEADLKNNALYVNIHTKKYPAGELRAQLNKQ